MPWLVLLFGLMNSAARYHFNFLYRHGLARAGLPSRIKVFPDQPSWKPRRRAILNARFCRRSCDDFGRDLTGRTVICHRRRDMTRVKHSSRQLRARDQSVDLITRAQNNSDVEIRSEAGPRGEIRRKARINSPPATVFALLTNASE